LLLASLAGFPFWFTILLRVGWGEEPGIYDTASISGVFIFIFFVGLRFSVCLRGFIPRPFFSLFNFCISLLAWLCNLLSFFDLLSFLGLVLRLFHGSGQMVVVNPM